MGEATFSVIDCARVSFQRTDGIGIFAIFAMRRCVMIGGVLLNRIYYMRLEPMMRNNGAFCFVFFFWIINYSPLLFCNKFQF